MSGPCRSGPARAASVLVLALAVHCGREEPAGPPEVAPELAAAVSLLDAARHGRLEPEDLAGRVSARWLGVADPALLDALDALDGAGPLRVTEPLVMPELGKAGLDVETELAGGATALYRLQTCRDADGGWRLAWLAGPGVEWPARRPSGESLSVSAPPSP